jgi:hypothetical protein
MMGDALLLQHVPDHFACGLPGRENRNRVAAQRVHRARGVDPAATRIVARRRAAQFVGWLDALCRCGDVERRVHRQRNDRRHYCRFAPVIALRHGRLSPLAVRPREPR